MVLDWGKSGKGRVIALRPHLIWGVGDPHLLPEIIERGRTGRLRIIGDGNNRVDVTRVENVAAAHLLALKALDKPSALNRPYFISQGAPVVLWDWINEVLDQLGIPPIKKRFRLASAFRIGIACEWLWRILGKKSVPPMTRFVSVELAKDHWFSIDAARAELNYRPEEYPMDEGLKLYAQTWLGARES
jgi:nucleoside-diphosphate-sugar epimerase